MKILWYNDAMQKWFLKSVVHVYLCIDNCNFNTYVESIIIDYGKHLQINVTINFRYVYIENMYIGYKSVRNNLLNSRVIQSDTY